MASRIFAMATPGYGAAVNRRPARHRDGWRRFHERGDAEQIKENGVSVWLKADLDVLWRRVRKRNHRPLLQNGDPEGVLKGLMDERYPVYAEADLAIVSQDGPHDSVVEDCSSHCTNIYAPMAWRMNW